MKFKLSFFITEFHLNLWNFQWDVGWVGIEKRNENPLPSLLLDFVLRQWKLDDRWVRIGGVGNRTFSIGDGKKRELEKKEATATRKKNYAQVNVYFKVFLLWRPAGTFVMDTMDQVALQGGRSLKWVCVPSVARSIDIQIEAGMLIDLATATISTTRPTPSSSFADTTGSLHWGRRFNPSQTDLNHFRFLPCGLLAKRPNVGNRIAIRRRRRETTRRDAATVLNPIPNRRCLESKIECRKGDHNDRQTRETVEQRKMPRENVCVCVCFFSKNKIEDENRTSERDREKKTTWKGNFGENEIRWRWEKKKEKKKNEGEVVTRPAGGSVGFVAILFFYVCF